MYLQNTEDKFWNYFQPWANKSYWQIFSWTIGYFNGNFWLWKEENILQGTNLLPFTSLSQVKNNKKKTAKQCYDLITFVLFLVHTIKSGGHLIGFAHAEDQYWSGTALATVRPTMYNSCCISYQGELLHLVV